MDTKWKILNSKDNEDYGIDSGDIYQMYVYSKKYQTPHVILLYPLFEEVEGLSPRYISNRKDGDIDTMVSIVFVDLSDMDKTLENINSAIEEQLKKVHKVIVSG